MVGVRKEPAERGMRWLTFLAKSVGLNVPFLMGNRTAQLELIEKLENNPVFMRRAQNPSISPPVLLFCLVAADIYVFGIDARQAFKIQFSHRNSVSRASSDRGRI
jgi:hypothetical protein